MATLTRSPSYNGAMPASLMARVPWDAVERVQAAALPSLVAMNAAYRRETGRNLDVTDSYRALGGYYGQVQTFLRRYRVQATGGGPFGDVRWYAGRRYVRHSSAGAAAVPGTSNHGWGLAIDFGPQSRWWVQSNGARFGWHWPAWARSGASYEPWHIEAGSDVVLVGSPGPSPSAPSIPTPGGTAPAPLNPKDWFDMATKAELESAVRSSVLNLLLEVSNRGTKSERDASDIVFNALRRTQHATLQAAANGSDATGRQMRDFQRRIQTGNTDVAASAALVASLQGQINALGAALRSTSGGGALDMAAIKAAAETGAEKGIRDVLGSLND